MTAKLFIKTHGCQMNEYDSDRMADLLKDSHELTITQTPNDAEVILPRAVSKARGPTPAQPSKKPRQRIRSSSGRRGMGQHPWQERPMVACWP